MSGACPLLFLASIVTLVIMFNVPTTKKDVRWSSSTIADRWKQDAIASLSYGLLLYSSCHTNDLLLGEGRILLFSSLFLLSYI